MSLDRKLLQGLDPRGSPILHFYDWVRPSATYGHFIDLPKHIDLTVAAAHGLQLARRPTGGGIVFHMWDLAFSFLMPSEHPACSGTPLENYRFVNGIVLEALNEYLSLRGEVSLTPESAPARAASCTHFCMARPTIYDVVHRGMKVAGAAQRRTKRGYLHQGTVSLAFPHLEFLRKLLLLKEELVSAMEDFAFAPLGREWTQSALCEARTALKALLHTKFIATLSRRETG